MVTWVLLILRVAWTSVVKATVWLWRHPRTFVVLLLVVGAFSVTGVVLYGVTKRLAQERDAAVALVNREREAHALELRGLVAGHAVDIGTLRTEVDDLRRSNSYFADALASTLQNLKAEKGKVAALIKGSTGPLSSDPGATGSLSSPGQADPSCGPVALFRQGDKGEVELTEAVITTDKGTPVLVAVPEVFRVEPGPRERIMVPGTIKKNVRFDYTPAPEVNVVRENRWWTVGLGVAAGLVTGYCTADKNHCGVR